MADTRRLDAEHPTQRLPAINIPEFDDYSQGGEYPGPIAAPGPGPRGGGFLTFFIAVLFYFILPALALWLLFGL